MLHLKLCLLQQKHKPIKFPLKHMFDSVFVIVTWVCIKMVYHYASLHVSPFSQKILLHFRQKKNPKPSELENITFGDFLLYAIKSSPTHGDPYGWVTPSPNVISLTTLLSFCKCKVVASLSEHLSLRLSTWTTQSSQVLYYCSWLPQGRPEQWPPGTRPSQFHIVELAPSWCPPNSCPSGSRSKQSF